MNRATGCVHDIHEVSIDFFFFFFLFPLHLYFKFETNVFSVDEIGMKKREGVAAESSLARIQKGLAKLAGPYLNNRVVRREGDAEIRGSVSRS